jgi:hypothetical protein
MTAHPDFGKELRRPFEVDERCADCAEFYDGCPARREDPDTFCPDYLRLPDVPPGATGQVFQVSKLQGRQPRPPRPGPTARVQVEAQPENPPVGRLPEQTRRQSPAATPGPDGERLCGCGALLRKRERCCAACRTERRKATMRRRGNGHRPLAASRSDPDVPFTHAGRPPTLSGSCAHN